MSTSNVIDQSTTNGPGTIDNPTRHLAFPSGEWYVSESLFNHLRTLYKAADAKILQNVATISGLQGERSTLSAELGRLKFTSKGNADFVEKYQRGETLAQRSFKSESINNDNLRKELRNLRAQGLDGQERVASLTKQVDTLAALIADHYQPKVEKLQDDLGKAIKLNEGYRAEVNQQRGLALEIAHLNDGRVERLQARISTLNGRLENGVGIFARGIVEQNAVLSAENIKLKYDLDRETADKVYIRRQRDEARAKIEKYLNKIDPKEETHATQSREVKSSSLFEHPYGRSGGQTTEAGSGYCIVKGRKVPAKAEVASDHLGNGSSYQNSYLNKRYPHRGVTAQERIDQRARERQLARSGFSHNGVMSIEQSDTKPANVSGMGILSGIASNPEAIKTLADISEKVKAQTENNARTAAYAAQVEENKAQRDLYRSMYSVVYGHKPATAAPKVVTDTKVSKIVLYDKYYRRMREYFTTLDYSVASKYRARTIGSDHSAKNAIQSAAYYRKFDNVLPEQGAAVYLVTSVHPKQYINLKDISSTNS